MLLKIIHGKVSSTVQQIYPQVQRHVDERRDVTVKNEFLAMKACLCMLATDMKNYKQRFIYQFGVYNLEISRAG